MGVALGYIGFLQGLGRLEVEKERLVGLPKIRGTLLGQCRIRGLYRNTTSET